MPSLTKYFTPRQLLFATFSFVVGVWTFIKVNEISGPAFEPIIEKCLSFSSFESMDAFVEETQLHEYNTFVGLKLFDLLVCLITQFLLELRNTYPAGLLTWSGVVLSAFGVAPTLLVESRRKGAKGLLIYPIVYGVLFQLFGVSVIFPLLWVPSYILGKGNGPVSVYCAKAAFWLNLPTVVLTTIVFVAHTDSYLWTLCAGILGKLDRLHFDNFLSFATLIVLCMKNRSLILLPIKEDRCWRYQVLLCGPMLHQILLQKRMKLV